MSIPISPGLFRTPTYTFRFKGGTVEISYTDGVVPKAYCRCSRQDSNRYSMYISQGHQMSVCFVDGNGLLCVLHCTVCGLRVEFPWDQHKDMSIDEVNRRIGLAVGSPWSHSPVSGFQPTKEGEAAGRSAQSNYPPLPSGVIVSVLNRRDVAVGFIVTVHRKGADIRYELLLDNGTFDANFPREDIGGVVDLHNQSELWQHLLREMGPVDLFVLFSELRRLMLKTLAKRAATVVS